MRYADDTYILVDKNCQPALSLIFFVNPVDYIHFTHKENEIKNFFS